MGNPLEEKISINNLISGFANYLQTLKAIAQKPLSFPDGLDLSAEGAFQQALAFMFYSLVLMFFILIPIFSKYGVEVSKVTFLLRFLIQFGIYTLMLHLSLKLFGASRSLKQTAVVYWHIIGFGAPLFLILVYPMLLGFGPAAILGTTDDVAKLNTFLTSNPSLELYIHLIQIMLAVLSYLVLICWFSRSHGLKKWRVALAVVTGGIFATLLQELTLNPLFHEGLNVIDQWLKYV